MHQPSTWYETPLRKLSAGQARRQAQPAAADFGFEESTRPRIDPYVTGLASALVAGAGRGAFIP